MSGKNKIRLNGFRVLGNARLQRPKKIICLSWISRFFFQAAAVIFVICVVTLLDRLFVHSFWRDLIVRLVDALRNASPSGCIRPILWLLDGIAAGFYRLHSFAKAWCACFVPDSVLSEIFILFGIVNFSYPYVSGARDKLLYGIHLNDVIYARFPWHNLAYGLYGLLVLMGLYCSEMGYRLLSAVCLLGAVFAFASTMAIAFLFTASRTVTQNMVEYYLCHPVKASRGFGKRKAASPSGLEASLRFMENAADYVREYYRETRSIPEEVIRSMWSRLHFGLTEKGLPVMDAAVLKNVSAGGKCAYPPATLEDICKTAEQITQMRSVWEHMLRGLTAVEREDLICRVLQILSKTLPDCPEEQLLCLTRGQRTSRRSGERLCLGLPLCGLLVCLRAQNSSWLDCMGLLYQISSPRVSRENGAYGEAVQLFFLLTLTLLTVEIAAGDTVEEDIWPKVSGVSEALQVPPSWLFHFLSWGQSMAISYTDDWYDTLLSLATHDTYGWLHEMLCALDDCE